MLMSIWLDKRASLTPHRTALIADGVRLTFAELRHQAQALARQLAGTGVKKHDTIGMLCGNGLHTAVLIHAIPYTGARLMPLNTRLTAHELAYQIEDGDCRLLLYDDPNRQLAESIRDKLPGLVCLRVESLDKSAGISLEDGSLSDPGQSAGAHIGLEHHALREKAALSNDPRQDAAQSANALREKAALSNDPRQDAAQSANALREKAALSNDPRQDAAQTANALREKAALSNDPRQDAALQTAVDEEQIATIMYTSGTTGAPKGVIHTYGNHWSSAIGSALNLGLHSEDVWLAAVPLFHISGYSILMRGVIYGIAVVIHNRFDPQEANVAIMEHGVSIVSVVSNMLARMLDDLGERTYPEHFRCMLLGGGPAPLPLLENCVKKGIPVFQTYGMTETASQIVTLPPEYMLAKLGSAGKPLFQSEVRIVDESGQDVAPGEAGEIVVRGPNVTKGYWNRPEATAQAMREGWFATGDIGYLDDEGFLYVLDRRKDLIISGGENVYPAEIESTLTGHPGIEDVGVTGMADERWGQVPVAFVVPREGAVLDEGQLRDYCSERLAKYKMPARFVFVHSLPRNAAGKLQRHELAKWLDGMAERND